MSAEILRRAADRMDERVAGATTGPYAVVPMPDGSSRNRIVSDFIVTRYASMDPTVAVIVARQYGDTEESQWGQTSDAEHLAAFSPEVVDTLASALRQHAMEHDSYDCTWDPCDLVTFARAYLGEPS